MTDQLDRLKAALADRYKLERQLGVGGMATVYLAEDLKHKRKVAVKVLRPELAAVLGAERFVQEITTTANLQHPHILPLFDSGEADGFLYYVMPFIDGETLRDKLNRETQLSIDEAVRITTDVADALDYAHSNSVIHRDIKPENILLHDGRPMVADFGIALALSAAAGGRMTETGLSLGTPHYMSPEQATAEKDLTNRSDIYSLGCVLYEMLTGEPPHTGGSAQQIIMKIVTEEPQPVTELRKSVPPNVAAAVSKALEKLSADRFESAATFAEALGNSAFTLPTTGPAAVASAPALWNRLSVGLAVAFTMAASVGLWGWLRPVPATRDSIRRLSLTLPAAAPLSFSPGTYGIVSPALALSPDGSLLTYVAEVDGGTQLYVRALESFEASPLPGTSGASAPFFSPDGRWIGFFTLSELRKVPVQGGASVVVTSVLDPHGGTWAPDGRIYFSQGEEGRVEIYWIPSGGVEEPTLTPVGGRWPAILPTGRALLLSTRTGVIVADLETGNTAFVADGSMGRYLSPGYVAYGHDGALWVVPFDLDRLRTTGDPVQVLGGLRREAEHHAAQFAVSEEGTLVFAEGVDIAEATLVWVEQDGSIDTLPFPPAEYSQFDLSPDETQIAVQVGGDIWIYDVMRESRIRLTTQGGFHNGPVWHPSGDRVAFVSATATGSQISSVTVDGTGKMEVLLPQRGDTSFWSPTFANDGETLSLTMGVGSGAGDAVVAESGELRVIAATPAGEFWTTISPEGRWVAYGSVESGEPHVYVQPYPPTGQRLQVSVDGGAEEPRWLGGDELVFRSGRQWLAVTIEMAPTFRASRPRVLREGDFINVPGWSWDMTNDGKRFLLVQGANTDSITNTLNVITNFFEELKAKVGN